MADPDLTTLARAWASHTTEPEFDALVGRARARRRRRVLALVASAAAVVLIAGLSTVLLQRGPSAAPLPTNHRKPAKVDPARDPSWIIGHGRLVSYAAGLGGWTSSTPTPPDAPDRVMTVWRHCRHESRGCRAAWRLTDWSGKVVATGLAGKGWNGAPTAYASGDMFVLRTWNRPGIAVDPDGSTRPIADADGGTVTAGDVLVRVGKSLAVVDLRSEETWPLPLPRHVAGWVDGTVSTDGTAWLLPEPAPGTLVRTIQVRWFRAGAWHQHLLWRAAPSVGGTPMPGLLVSSGEHVAAMSSFDGATVLPVGTFAVTADDGRHWTDLTKRQLPFDFVDSMAATDGGTLYVVGSPDGRGAWELFRSTDASWTNFEQVPGAHDIAGLDSGGPVVLAFSGSLGQPGLVAYDDHGNRADVPIR